MDTQFKKTETQSEYIVCAKANRRLRFPFTPHSAPLSPQIKMTQPSNQSYIHLLERERKKNKLKQCTLKHFFLCKHERTKCFSDFKIHLVIEPLGDGNTLFLLKDETHRVCNQHCAVSALAKPPIRHSQTFYLLKRYKQSALKSFQHCKNSLNHINTHIYIQRRSNAFGEWLLTFWVVIVNHLTS